MRTLFLPLLSLGLVLALSGCHDAAEPEPAGAPDTTSAADTADSSTPDYAPLEPEPAVLLRLTQAQYLNAMRDLFGEGLTLPSSLEIDTRADGLLAVGAGVAPISPRGSEQYEEAALSIGRQVVEPPFRAAVVPCEPSGAADAACYEAIARTLGRRAWRRPLTDDEATQAAGIGTKAGEALGDFYAGAGYVVSFLLQSPHFLYRSELGSAGELSDLELASRLAFFFWNSLPDEALLTAAENGELSTEAGILAQATRLLDDPKSRRGVRNFFTEWLHLDELHDMSKDPNIFRHYAPTLGEAAAEETLRFVEHLIFDQEADMKAFYTSTTTFVDRRLAAIYNVPAAELEGFGQIELPEDGQRRGFLGQVAFLALHSHPVSSSATLRGLFIREALLCEQQPEPPSGLNTAIPEPDANARTLKERLTVHMEDEFCASCHQYTDLLGLGLENFDGIGRFRLTDNEAIIDPSGALDALEFDDGRALTDLLANDPRSAACMVQRLYSYGVGRPLNLVVGGERGQVKELADNFAADGRRFKNLMLAIATSPGFRSLAEVE